LQQLCTGHARLSHYRIWVRLLLVLARQGLGLRWRCSRLLTLAAVTYGQKEAKAQAQWIQRQHFHNFYLSVCVCVSVWSVRVCVRRFLSAGELKNGNQEIKMKMKINSTCCRVKTLRTYFQLWRPFVRLS